MRRPPRLPAVALALWLPLSAVAAAERTPLAAQDLDVIHLADGRDVMGGIEAQEPSGDLRVRTTEGARLTIPAGALRAVDRRRTLAEAVARRGDEALAAGDWIDLQRVLRFVAERREKAGPAPEAGEAAAQDAALALAARAQERRPGRDLLEPLLPLLWQRRDLARLVALGEQALAADPTWSAGWSALVRAQRERGDAAALAAVIARWRSRQPTALEVNQVVAAEAAARGDWRTAQECWRKGFDLHQDWESAAGLALAALHRGEAGEAERACRALLAAGQRTAEARALLGAALLARGDEAAAAGELEPALAAGLADGPVAAIARYDLGLIRQRAGRAAEAAALWRQSAHPLAALALARQEGRAWTAPADASPALAALAAEHNALVALQAGRGDAAAGLDPQASPRSQRIAQCAAVLASAGGEAAVRALAGEHDPESLRWQAYGHLLANRPEQAEALLGRLPGDDAWALAVRVHLAALRKDELAARTWFQRLAAAPNPPAAYLARLAAEFASALDEEVREGFDWGEAEVLAVGWQMAAPGTGVAVQARSGRLVFAGTQREPGATRAWRLLPAARLRSVQVACDVSAAAAAEVWIEVVDEARRNGWALGPGPGGQRVRELRDGAWSPWQPVGLAGAGALRIDIDQGACWAVDAGDPAQRVRLGAARAEGVWAVGLAGSAPAGTAWIASFDDLVIGLRPAGPRP